MRFPLDLEDIIGVALADVVRRAGMFFGSVLFGTLVGGIAVLAGEFVAWRMETGAWGSGFFDVSVGSVMLLPLRPVFSAWGFLYIPLLLSAGIFYVKSESPGLRSLAVFTTLVALFAVLGRGEPSWFRPNWFSALFAVSPAAEPEKLYAIMIAVGLALWLGLCGSLWFLLIFIEQRMRAGAEQHLALIALENEARRRELREKHGTAIADRDFLVGEPREGEPGRDQS